MRPRGGGRNEVTPTMPIAPYAPERDDELAREAHHDDHLSVAEEPILATEEPEA